METWFRATRLVISIHLEFSYIGRLVHFSLWLYIVGIRKMFTLYPET